MTDTQKIDFWMSLATELGEEAAFLRALEEARGNDDLGVLLEHLSTKDATRVQRLAKRLVSERLRGWSER